MNPEQFREAVLNWQGTWFLLGIALTVIVLTLAPQKKVDAFTRSDFIGVYMLSLIAIVTFVMAIMPYVTSWVMLLGIPGFGLLIGWIVAAIYKLRNKPQPKELPAEQTAVVLPAEAPAETKTNKKK